MKNINKIIIMISSLLITTNILAEGNAAKGKNIYLKSECVRCHQTDQLFTRKDRKVKSLSQLDSQVRKCDTQLNTHLFDDEIEDVVAYLNEAYYKFEKNNNKKNKTNRNNKTQEPTGG